MRLTAAGMTYLDVSFFSLHTEKLVEVLYERKYCRPYVDLSMLCSRVIAINRHNEDSNALLCVENNDCVENEHFSIDEFDLHSDKRKLGPTNVENVQNNILKYYVKGEEKIISALKNIGLICKNDKMYTLKPSQMYYYKHNITCYSPNRSVFAQKLNTLLDSPDKYNTDNRLFNSKMSPEKNLNNCIDENQNDYQDLSITNGNIYSERSYWNHNQQKLPFKYWSMRHMLFSKFDLGILLDEESFYSVCPEILSYHIAKRCENDIALDPFCGAGGNIIQLALTCKLVIAIDIDPNKIRLARHNAEIYGVADKIEFIVGDFFTMGSMLKADVIFMSPPWGGPEYSVDDSFSIESMCKDHFGGGYGIFDIVKNIAPSIAFHMPKTTNIFECLWLAKDFGRVEIQQNIINEKLNSITAFYGEFTDLMDSDY